MIKRNLKLRLKWSHGEIHCVKSTTMQTISTKSLWPVLLGKMPFHQTLHRLLALHPSVSWYWRAYPTLAHYYRHSQCIFNCFSLLLFTLFFSMSLTFQALIIMKLNTNVKIIFLEMFFFTGGCFLLFHLKTYVPKCSI